MESSNLTFSELPKEIKEEILSRVPPYYRIVLAQISKEIYEICLNFKYEGLVLNLEGGDVEVITNALESAYKYCDLWYFSLFKYPIRPTTMFAYALKNKYYDLVDELFPKIEWEGYTAIGQYLRGEALQKYTAKVVALEGFSGYDDILNGLCMSCRNEDDLEELKEIYYKAKCIDAKGINERFLFTYSCMGKDYVPLLQFWLETERINISPEGMKHDFYKVCIFERLNCVNYLLPKVTIHDIQYAIQHISDQRKIYPKPDKILKVLNDYLDYVERRLFDT